MAAGIAPQVQFKRKKAGDRWKYERNGFLRVNITAHAPQCYNQIKGYPTVLKSCVTD